MQELVFLKQDTIRTKNVDGNKINTEVSTVVISQDSVVARKAKTKKFISDSVAQKTNLSDKNITIIDSTIKINNHVYNPYNKSFNNSINFLKYNQISELKYKQLLKYQPKKSFIEVEPAKELRLCERIHITSNWVFFIFFFLILIFIWIRIFYNKIFNYLFNSFISYQLSLKMYNERNALLKRVSFILDILYHIILSFFIYESFTFLNIKPLGLTSFNLFLFSVNVLILFTIARYLVLNIFNKLFDTESIIAEYNHNNFIINKLLGIVLFPVIIAFYYVPEKYSGLMFFGGLAIIGMGYFMKILRGYQIIIRKEILFYYLILYLCTLEILPLFIGYKVFISLL